MPTSDRRPIRRLLLAGLLLCAAIALAEGETFLPETPVLGYRVLASYPHDPSAFTQGLIYADGQLYEGTGNYGRSVLRRVDLETGRVEQETRLESRLFGEGITHWGDRLIQLTWREHLAILYDRDSLERMETFRYAGEGWGLTHDGRHWIMSDGTQVLRFIDPESHQVVRRLGVTDQGRPVRDLNELEYIDGEVWANIWKRDLIARIDPETGEVASYLDLSGLAPEGLSRDAVLNGIAYDARGERLFVTGKYWPRLFWIQVVPR
ncbi:glutaminyl-peptide cyclotransferase [Imhoffiella purpurea]|uniref:Glutamine cyclotransferase n=1 Tax=Imhoffiella purpurea TaxID=1249627 RepID=W9VG81_9GAMM|nr:glutaminyl-peptide cyclotransferase [Imhoffiella purpurea]EXJ16006.1 Glutamine cyclotransferase [Imhoffiella purpurea]